MPKARNQKGFSLLEVIVVMAIGMILLGFAVPMFQSAMRIYTLNSAASNITRLMQLGRISAIRKGSGVCTVVDGNQIGLDGLNLAVASDVCDGVLNDREPRYVLPAGVTLDGTGPGSFAGMNFSSDPEVPGGFVLTFNPRGSTTVSPTVSVIYLTGWDRFSAVTVSGAGRARTWRYEGESWY